MRGFRRGPGRFVAPRRTPGGNTRHIALTTTFPRYQHLETCLLHYPGDRQVTSLKYNYLLKSRPTGSKVGVVEVRRLKTE